MTLFVILIGSLLYAMAASGMWFFADLLVVRFHGLDERQRRHRVLLLTLLWPLALVFFGHASVKQAAIHEMSR